jgi:hypothetical protein
MIYEIGSGGGGNCTRVGKRVLMGITHDGMRIYVVLAVLAALF